MDEVLNISAYKFTPLSGLPELRERWLTRGRELELRGTILLSAEGVNAFLAGPTAAVRAMLASLREVAGLEDLTAKESGSAERPFGRFQVKIKKEIISFGVEGLDPARRPAAKIAPPTLKQWLDEGRAVTLLDTRNDYEVKLGTFRGALDPRIERFREFAEAARRLPPELKERPVVMFCTGGIRCEKAGPFLEREGFRQVFQLEGGILKYFEECGGAHFDGECFVFDERVGLDGNLRPTGAVLCEVCQMPVTRAEQADARYVAGKSCPACAEPAAVGGGAVGRGAGSRRSEGEKR